MRIGRPIGATVFLLLWIMWVFTNAQLAIALPVEEKD